MARRRINFGICAAFAALIGSAPVAAQSTNNAAAAQTATPIPSPPPATSGNAVGPPQLRDFNLNGTVTQPAPAVTTQPRASPPTSPPSTTPGETNAPSAVPPRAAPSPRAPSVAAPDRDPLPDAVTVDLPPATAAPILPEPSFTQPPVADTAVTPASPEPTATNWWPWLATLLAAALGGAFLWRRRQKHGEQRYAADHADLGALVAAPDAAPIPSPRVPAPEPNAPLAPYTGAASTPARPQPFRPTAPPAPAPAPEPIAGGIVASGLKPHIEFELVPLRAESDETQGAALTFDIIVINRGSAPARDVLVEAQLINAGPQVNAEVGRFFLHSPQDGERAAMIPPMGRIAIRMRLALPSAAIAPLIVEGRKLLVPVIAINALYRWSGGELKNSSSFLVGRGDSEAEKLAPFRLDLGARSWSGLAARLHSNGLQA